MDFVKKLKSTFIGMSVIYLVLGIVMVISPVFVSNFICYFIGALLIIAGCFGIFSYIQNGGSGFLVRATLLISILFAALGIYILINPETFVSIIPIIVGIMLMLESLDKIGTVFKAKNNGYEKWLQILIAPVIIFILGLILIIYPFSAVTVFIRVIGVFLIIDAISNIYLAYSYSKI